MTDEHGRDHGRSQPLTRREARDLERERQGELRAKRPEIVTPASPSAPPQEASELPEPLPEHPQQASSPPASDDVPTAAPATAAAAAAEPDGTAPVLPEEFWTPRTVDAVEPAQQQKSPRRRRLTWLWVLIGLLAVGSIGAAATWVMFEDQVRKVMGWELPIDYEGDGNGEPVTVVIAEGEIGEDVARTLHEAGVTMTFEAFYRLLLQEQPTFTPGAYQLEKQMSAASALQALQDPANRVEARATIREGITQWQVFAELSAATGVPVADYEAVADPALYGLPASLPSLEGYLFPATYTFNPGVGAQEQLAQLVSTMTERLDALGVAPGDRHRVLTIASLLQREARQPEDFARVSRVIENRLAEGMPLQFDSTSHYGIEWRTGESTAGESVWTTDEERSDDNPYNTYVHAGLPIGPISAPGDLALEAALHPADGSWLYFVTVDLNTGETVFSTTLAEHEAAVEQLRGWCRANPGSGC
ncbi:endolytic transglycosylase MltG [Ruicaihuangia caeni]|uniref:Endolytic murein transglycosylase n=1 Tax=Ruicaihuangia caeni TaxID=3042517 RepID=A0AAW6T2M7_9MICO|nr:endolytic transglycosylase MltG [Klugiella sp. YN-L-19]MDI2098061.1 endolytic transglycosylase MltG [Klugiella sp. YN-L-19]